MIGSNLTLRIGFLTSVLSVIRWCHSLDYLSQGGTPQVRVDQRISDIISALKLRLIFSHFPLRVSPLDLSARNGVRFGWLSALPILGGHANTLP